MEQRDKMTWSLTFCDKLASNRILLCLYFNIRARQAYTIRGGWAHYRVQKQTAVTAFMKVNRHCSLPSPVHRNKKLRSVHYWKKKCRDEPVFAIKYSWWHNAYWTSARIECCSSLFFKFLSSCRITYYCSHLSVVHSRFKTLYQW